MAFFSIFLYQTLSVVLGQVSQMDRRHPRPWPRMGHRNCGRCGVQVAQRGADGQPDVRPQGREDSGWHHWQGSKRDLRFSAIVLHLRELSEVIKIEIRAP